MPTVEPTPDIYLDRNRPPGGVHSAEITTATRAAVRAELAAIRYQVGALRPVRDLLAGDVPIERVDELLRSGVTGYSELEKRPAELLGALIGDSLMAADIAPSDVDAVILVTESFAQLFGNDQLSSEMFRNVRNQSFDFLNELGIDKASVYSTSYGGCTNLLHATLLAQVLVERGLSKNVLLIAAEKFISSRARLMDEAISISGDGIASCLITSMATSGSGAFSLRHISIAPYQKLSPETDMPRVVLEMYQAMKKVASDSYDTCGLRQQDFRWLVLGDYNPLTSTTFGKLLGFSPERIFMENVGKMGHIPFDPLIGLQTLHEQNKVNRGDLILIFVCGPVSCGSIVVEYV